MTWPPKWFGCLRNRVADTGRNDWLAGLGVLGVLVVLAAIPTGGSILGEAGPLLALVAGATVIGLALFAFDDRRYVGSVTASRAEVEHGYRVQVPGQSFEPSSASESERQSFERRLTRRIVASLVENRGIPPGEAEQHIEQGTWTDDAVAASLLASQDHRVPLRYRMRWWVHGSDPYERRAERAIEALIELREGQS